MPEGSAEMLSINGSNGHAVIESIDLQTLYTPPATLNHDITMSCVVGRPEHPKSKFGFGLMLHYASVS
jgi:hypothetical protein